MAGHIQRLTHPAGILRVVRRHGDPFTVTVTVEYLTDTEVFVHGLKAEGFTADHYAAVVDVMRESGIEFYQFVRYKRGQAIPHRHSTHARFGPACADGGTGPQQKGADMGYDLKISFETVNQETGKKGGSFVTLEGDAALRRSIQRDLLALVEGWLKAEEAAESANGK